MKKTVLNLMIALAAYGLTGCGGSSQNLAPAGYNCVGYGCVTTNGTATAPTFTSGDTEAWNPVSLTVLDEYEGGGQSVSNPTSPIVNIALTPTGTNQYNGTLTIQFVDGTYVHNGTFSNGNGTETYRGYNQSVNALVGSTYRIYFEDPLGSIILTMSQQTGTDTTTTSSGSLYFMNFNSTAPNPLYQGASDGSTYFPPGIVFCWMIDYGPYACINNSIPPTTPYEVKEGDWTVPAYTLLGTIPTINLTNALGN